MVAPDIASWTGTLPTSFTADASASLPGPSWLAERRAAAFERFDGATLPSSAEEIWRYSRIDDLDPERFRPNRPDATSTVCATLLTVPPGSGDDGWGTVTDLVGGVPAGGAAGSAPGVATALFGTAARAGDALAHLAEAFLDELIVVYVRPGMRVPGPISIRRTVGRGASGSFPRTLVVIGDGAEATVVESVVSAEGVAVNSDMAPDGATLVMPTTEIIVADNAQLSYVNVQDLPHDAWHIGYQASYLGRDARLASFTAAFGGGYARSRTDSVAAGTGSETSLLAAYFGSDDQMHDFRTLQDHEAARTRSDLVFKGAVADRATSVYSGLIRVRKGAVRTVAFQENRNLVLSEGAHADSVPNLDIQENDVRCSHASAVGPIDPDQLYYLESRGISPESAERMIVEGFFDEMIDRVPEASGVRDMLARAVGAKMASVYAGVGVGDAP